jgi:surfactin synthase thioesterase subunit
VNFEPMARALRGRVAVYAVELPGHDLAGESEPFASIDQVVEQVVAEIARRGLTDVLLWGHSSGTATAVATARALEARGVPVRRVFLGAQLLGDADRRRAAIAELAGQSDSDIAARLATAGGYTAVDELDVQRAGQVGAAYRHDCLSAHRHFLGALDNPSAPKLAAPITVVVAADDPSTADVAQRHREWRLLADQVDLHELADGGHYFLRTRPAEAAAAVLQCQ